MPNGPPRYGVKDLGSVVVGAGPTADEERWDRSDEDKTLSDARFVVGDYISCAVLPPKDDGSVALVPISRPEPSRSMHDGRGSHRGLGLGFGINAWHIARTDGVAVEAIGVMQWNR